MKRIFVSLFCIAAMACTATAVDGVIAVPTRDKGQAVYINDARVYPTGYNIADNNYFKLRDIGTLVGFGVEWNGETQTVEISTARTTPSTEGISDTAASGAVAKISDQKITVDGVQVNMTAYQIDGNNYVKLRDIGKQVDFGVGYDNATASVRIDTDAPYTESTTSASGSAITKWNKIMAEFNQAMINCDWDKSKYLTTAKQYAPIITGKASGTVEDVIATLDAMKGAPVDAVSFDDNPVNMFWANQLRKALGEDISDNGNAENNSSDEMVDTNTLEAYAQEVIRLTNEERAKAGLPALKVNDKLMQAAAIRAEELTENFSHTRPNGTDTSTVYNETGIELTARVIFAENIVKSTVWSSDVAVNNMQAWMNSEGHRNQILRKDLSELGVAYAIASDGTVFCAQLFLGYE